MFDFRATGYGPELREFNFHFIVSQLQVLVFVRQRLFFIFQRLETREQMDVLIHRHLNGLFFALDLFQEKRQVVILFPDEFHFFSLRGHVCVFIDQIFSKLLNLEFELVEFMTQPIILTRDDPDFLRLGHKGIITATKCSNCM